MRAFSFIKRTIFWTNDFFHGGVVYKFYSAMNKTLKSKKDGVIIQQHALDSIINYAVTNSPFYKVYEGKRISDFPIVDKNFLKEHLEEIKVPIERIPNQGKHPLCIQKTSGSTGSPFAIPMDYMKRKRRIAEIKWFNKLIGFNSHDMLVQCRVWTNWHKKNNSQILKENIIPVNIQSMDDTTLEKLCRTVKQNKAKFILAYAGWYDSLFYYIQNHPDCKKDLKTVKACISCSEALNTNTKDKMLEYAHIPIVERYSNEEGGMLGQKTLKFDNFILNHSGYYFEFIKLDSDEPAGPGELSRIVITDLYNHAFPLIRYDTGDTAIYALGDATSGGWDYITKLYGRRLDLIFDSYGSPVHPMSFARILKNIDGIKQWQFIQNDETKYMLKLNCDKNLDENNCKNAVKKVLGDKAEIEIEYVDEIPVLGSGKRKAVINNWRK